MMLDRRVREGYASWKKLRLSQDLANFVAVRLPAEFGWQKEMHGAVFGLRDQIAELRNEVGLDL